MMLKSNPTKFLTTVSKQAVNPALKKNYFHARVNSVPISKSTTTPRLERSSATQFGLKHFSQTQFRFFATKVVKVPAMGDSITEGTIQKWQKQAKEGVKTDDIVVNIETDKVVVDIRAPENGVITKHFAAEGDVLKVGADLYEYEPGAAPAAAPAAPKQEAPAKPQFADKPEVKAAEPAKAPAPAAETKPASKPAAPAPAPVARGERTENRVKMTRIRARTAERLKSAQNTYAMLTTFNEVDMSAITTLRNQYKEDFEKKHGIKLGFMSVFVKAAAAALREQPLVNAVIEGDEIVYRNYVDISVAVSAPNGLVVPVIRDADQLSFAGVEKALSDLSKKARDGQLAIEDMAGGTFTISNGGVFGSLMGTPIINPPQSAILGMHAVKNRPVAVGDKIEIRPMMYLALTYDHKIIDGREAVTFLKKIKDTVEDPRRLLLEL